MFGVTTVFRSRVGSALSRNLYGNLVRRCTTSIMEHNMNSVDMNVNEDEDEKWAARLEELHSNIEENEDLPTDVKTERVREFYDSWSSFYESTSNGWGYDPHETAANFIMKNISRNELIKMDLIDFGCGTGFIGEEFIKEGIKLNSLIGCDLSPKQLKLASKRGLYDELREFNMNSFPYDFDDKSCDLITCTGVFSYLSDHRLTLHEFARILRKGGYFIFSHREDVDFVDMPDFNDGKWECVDIISTKHMPNNPKLDMSINIYVGRVIV